MPKSKSRFRKNVLKPLMGLLLVALIGSQFVPVDRTNPPVDAALKLDAPPEVMAILERACFDCHSHNTHWPWYAYVAPASLLVAHDVEEGREHLNFSEWNARTPSWQSHHAEEIVEEIEEGEMPLWFYTPLHPEAEISESDLDTLREWAASFPTDA